MGMVMALAGKGGTGKTSICALVVKHLIAGGKGSVLAVDADPAANLGPALGVDVKETVVDIVDEVGRKQDSIPAGMTRERFISYRVQETVAENKGFDLVTMGKPEGPGCYCYANTIVRDIMGKLADSYSYTIMDNEAGMEHLSRRTARKIDVLLVTSDASAMGLRAAAGIYRLAKQMGLLIGRAYMVVNRVNARDLRLTEDVKAACPEVAGIVPPDDEVMRLNTEGGSLGTVSDDCEAYKAVQRICEKVLA